MREHLSRWWFVRRAVRKFMPGEELEDAMAAAERHRSAGINAVFTLLGENVTAFAEAEDVARHYHRVLDEVAARDLDAEISVKLTQLGLDLDADGCARLVEELADDAARRGNWVWIDMEASNYVDATLAIYERVAGPRENVGLCLQAYLKRTPTDIARLLPVRPSARLVKGAYDEPVAIAYRSHADVDAAYSAVAVQLLEAVAAGQARRVILGTHDSRLVDQIARSAEAVGIQRNRVEVQMLYGIRAGEQRRLASEGFDVRCLIAYGRFWYPWYMRRLAERPANVVFALRQLLP
jgi:proline dehydrogenase